jgi:guanosine-3',5'-bis(diphosphate) 3'-pyrophosphohydrolase
LHDPPAHWSIKRKQEYFDWAKAVVDQTRNASKKLGKVFDEVYAQKPLD